MPNSQTAITFSLASSKKMTSAGCTPKRWRQVLLDRALHPTPLTLQSNQRKQIMPTILKVGRHRFFFFSREDQEPPHIHVESAENAAKFWLRQVTLDWAVGYNSKELRQVRQIVEEHAEFFLEKWYEHHK